MIKFKNINGDVFLAVGSVKRKSALNGEKSLSATITQGDDVLNKIDKGWSLEFDNEPYVVTYFERNDNDNTVEIDAIHKFFWDMTKSVLYATYSSSHVARFYLDEIFKDTGYTYALNFDPKAFEKENWGMKNKLSLFNDIISSIGAEFEINGTLISIFKNVGSDLSTIVRHGFNLSDMTLENDNANFATYAEGFGAYEDQENQKGPRLHVTYKSSLAKAFGKLHAEPVDDQRYTVKDNLLQAVKDKVDGSFAVSVKLSLYDLTAAGYPYKMANVGDWLLAVDENLDFKQKIRIISVDDEFAEDGTRISYTVTCGDVGVAKKYQDANASLSQKVQSAYDNAQAAKESAIQAVISSTGKNTNYRFDSVDEMNAFQGNEGDLAFVQIGDGQAMYVYTKMPDGSFKWVKRLDPDTGEQIAAGVEEAISTANTHTDEVKQGLSSDIETAKSQAASQADSALASARSEATSQFTQAQNSLSAAKTDLTKSIASEASERTQAVAAANSQAQTYANQAKSDAMSAASSADGVIRTSISSSANSLSSTITQNKSSADSGISTAQTTAKAAVDGLAFKVSKTDYDQKTGDLSTKINNVKDTADSSAQTIADIKIADGKQDTRMAEIENTASGLKSTVSDISTAQGKQSGSISTLQQRADGFDATVAKINTTVNSLGQINQLFNTEFNPDLACWTQVSTSYRTTGATRYGSTILKVVSDDGNYLYQDIPVSNGVVSFSSIMQLDDGFSGSFRFGINFRDSNYAYISAGGTTWGTNNTTAMYYTLQKVENISVPAGASYVRINYQFMGTGFGRIIQPMLVFESTVGTYVQGNYNNNDALAKVKLTADEASAALTKLTNADGIITKAQADIKANADAISEKVSKTVYDKNTGDLTQAISKAQSTADGAVSTVGNYQTSNDKRVGAAESTIEQHSKDIAARVTRTDYDYNNSQLDNRFTKVEATADGASTTVGKLQTTVNNLGQINQLFNTEFTPDFQSWTQVSTAYRTTGNTKNGSNVVKVVGDDGDYLYQDVAVSTGVVSFSSIMRIDDGLSGAFRFAINFRDSNHNYVSAGGITWGPNNTSALNYTLQKVENIAVPTGAAYVRINYQFRGTGVARFLQPMLVFSDHVGAYVQGNYNNNSALAQVKITADNISNFVRDSSGNISSDFQTALSRTSIITGSTLAASIQTQTSSQIASAITDNNGKIISLINQDSSGVQIAGKNIILDGPTTVTDDFYAKGGNFKNLNASNLTVGTLNGSQVNITNMNASNIVTGALTGITLMSSADGSQFKVQGNNLQMVKKNGDNLQLSTDGLFWKDSSGNVLFEASNKITTSDIFGTAEYNVYLASLNETRSVTYATALTGSGGVSDYNYVPHRTGGIYTTWVEVNASGGAENVYIRPLTAQSEARITASGGTDSYANLRARYIYANRIAINSRTDAQQLYLQTGDEVRVKSTNDDVDNSAYKAIRASAFNSASLAEYKQNIEVSGISGLDEINKSTIYNYQLKTSPDKQEVGLVIGDGYDISQIVVDGDGVNQYRMVALAWKAIQELTQRVNTLEQELESKGK